MAPKSLLHELGAEATILFIEILQRENYFRERNMLTEDGYFFNTNQDMSSATGISERSLKRLYEVLKSKKLIDITYRGMPRRTHIKVCYENEAAFEKLLYKGEDKLYKKEDEVAKSHRGNQEMKKLREDYQKKSIKEFESAF